MLVLLIITIIITIIIAIIITVSIVYYYCYYSVPSSPNYQSFVLENHSEHSTWRQAEGVALLQLPISFMLKIRVFHGLMNKRKYHADLSVFWSKHHGETHGLSWVSPWTNSAQWRCGPWILSTDDMMTCLARSSSHCTGVGIRDVCISQNSARASQRSGADTRERQWFVIGIWKHLSLENKK